MKPCIADPSGTPDARLSRRHLLQVTVATTVLVAALGRSDAWAGATPPALDGWGRDLVDLNQALTRGEITVLDWQARVARLNQSTPHVTGQGRRTWFVRVFGLRRGGAIIPHVH